MAQLSDGDTIEAASAADGDATGRNVRWWRIALAAASTGPHLDRTLRCSDSTDCSSDVGHVTIAQVRRRWSIADRISRTRTPVLDELMTGRIRLPNR